MKTVGILSILALSLLLTACGDAVQPPRNEVPRPTPPAAAQIGAAASPGQVSIGFDFQRMHKRASDQLAVWIEDAQGKHVRTLLMTKFTAGGGYQKRPEAVPHWQKSFQPEANTGALDAVSSATPQSGRISLVWDCRDQAGAAVAPGVYVYKVEANIEWEKTALWQGTITVGPAAGQSAAVAVTNSDSPLLQAVQADFVPAS
ncbi:MAG TPA: DUF2271 domain-containing protein [Methylomusa anaerophila]|uniref:DUF2271 domain-containing protein n=1 Tax=Methylomusa anaerophila TaxID=1930071 RepID=A0A348AIP2_9FIRM|nr:DUF2271 domain-containing protein [Methylomusa anaerophila]BBB90940.1 hypothetical protein MAMMFC1_01607 [Methylomusa anaerophila]HML90433.1 DUF2271 domain-containing protein [Methylomusa anaerophila]